MTAMIDHLANRLVASGTFEIEDVYYTNDELSANMPCGLGLNLVINGYGQVTVVFGYTTWSYQFGYDVNEWEEGPFEFDDVIQYVVWFDKHTALMEERGERAMEEAYQSQLQHEHEMRVLEEEERMAMEERGDW